VVIELTPIDGADPVEYDVAAELTIHAT